VTPAPGLTTSRASQPGHRVGSLPGLWPVLVVAGLMAALLLAVSGQYGFHPDETYYVVAGQHPAFGYVDQGPVTPLLSALSVALLGVSPTAVRVLPAIEMALVVVLVALMARDLGGSRRAQVLAAVTAAVSGYLAGGHIDSTSEPDLLAWAVILWLLVKLLAGGDRRLWLAVGVVAGIGLENKDTVLFLGAGLAAGLVLARRWDVVRSPFAWRRSGSRSCSGSPTSPGRPRTAGRSSRWRRPSAATPPTTGRRSCRSCGCSPASSSSR